MPEDAVRTLPAGHPSLVLGCAAEAGSLAVLGASGGVVLPPAGTGPVTFGRNTAVVTVPLGEDDRRISRVHGVLESRGGRWWVRAVGKVPLRVPRLLFPGAGAVPLSAWYVPVYARGSGDREHVLEVLLADGRPVRAPTGELSRDERLALAMVARGFLRGEDRPVPMRAGTAAARLAGLYPADGWDEKRVRAAVSRVRDRFCPGERELIRTLLAGGVLAPPDLALLSARGAVPDAGSVTWGR